MALERVKPRRFKLTNSKGEVLDLLNQNGPMFFEPDGLGFNEEADWFRLGTNYSPVNIYQSQRIISGKMIFLDENKAYENYYKFIRFVHEAPLTLEYTAYDKFYIDVRMQSIEKTELNTYGCLECKVQFSALGLFYKYIQRFHPKTIEPITPENWTYPYRYDHMYPGESENSLTFNLDVSYESPIQLIIYGPCTSPQWLHYVDGKFVASGKYNGYLGENRRLVVDATTVPYRIYETTDTGEFIGDRYGGCDFSTERFIYFSPGENKLSVGHEDLLNSIAFMVRVKQSYESV